MTTAPFGPASQPFPVDATRAYSSLYTGAGATWKHSEGMGVVASLNTNAVWRMPFVIPATIPTGTLALQLWARANAVTGTARVNAKWACCPAGTNPSTLTLAAEGVRDVIWAAGDNDKFKRLTIVLDATSVVAGSMLLLDLTFETASWTLAQPSSWMAFLEFASSVTDSPPGGGAPPPVQSVATWKTKFDNNWPSESAAATAFSTSGDAAKHYLYAYRGFDANLSMWRATGDTTYLDRVITWTLNMIGTARPANTISGNVYSDSFLGWPNLTETDIAFNREWWLLDIFIWRHVATLIRHMSYNPTIMANSTYLANYNTILAFTETNIWQKWNGRSGKFYDTIHILSHWILINMAIAELSTTPANRTAAQLFVDQATYTGMGSYAGVWAGKHIKGMMQINPLFPTAYTWTLDTRSTGLPNDFGHGACVFNFISEQYDRGYVWTATDIDRFVGTIRDVLLFDSVAPIVYPFYVDGSSTGSLDGTHGWVPDGGFTMGRYNVACQQKLEAFSSLAISNNDASSIYGMGALAAAYLFGTKSP